MVQVLNLSGKWYIKHDPNGDLEKAGLPYMDAIDTAGFWEIQVPSHWQTQGFDYQGTVWYYREFDFDREVRADEKVFLRFEGVDYSCEVWLNGVYLGAHEGDFDSFRFEVTEELMGHNRLLVKVESGIDARPEFKQILKGAVYHWDCVPVKQQGLTDCPEVPSSANSQYPNPIVNPGGIWKPVYLEINKGYILEEMRVTPHLVGQNDALLHIQGWLYSWDQPGHLTVEVHLEPDNFAGRSYNHSFTVFVSPGQNSFSESIRLEKPSLWWTWDLGQPHLYNLNLRVCNEAGAEALTYSMPVGIREVSKGANWELYLNGKRFFARGTNYLSDQFLSLSTTERYDQDLQMMLDANMNMVRVFSHMENEYFYSQCDRLGILVWQDLPFQWGYDPSPQLIKKAKDLAERFVVRLANHPCIFLWCCHSESRLHDYNKLDSVLERAVQKLDPSRPVWRNSVLAAGGEPPKYFSDLDSFGAYVSNNLSVHWVGWYWGKVDDAEWYNPYFVTEFGTQSIPNLPSLQKFIEQKDLWPPNWDEWRYRGFQLNIYEKNLGKVPDTLKELIEITQEYQHRFYKQHIEALRRKKYKDVNGLLQFHFVNTWPAIDWSIIDYYRVPKKAYYTIKEAFSPVLLSFTGDFTEDGVCVSAWIVNDLHTQLEGLSLHWKVLVDGELVHEETVPIEQIPADSTKIYACKDFAVREREVVAQGSLVQEDRIISANENILKPYNLTDIETPQKAGVGL